MSKLRKFVSVVGSAVTLVASCEPLRSMAMDPNSDKMLVVNDNDKRENELNSYHTLTGDEYEKLDEKNITVYRTCDNFLIDRNMNYLNVDGDVITDERQKVYVDTAKKEGTKVYDDGSYIVEYIELHPILKYLEDHLEYIKPIKYGSNGEKCFLTFGCRNYLVLRNSDVKSLLSNDIYFDSFNERQLLTLVGYEGESKDLYEGRVDADVVYFPKKMLEKYRLKECEPRRLDELKEAEKKYLENKAKEKENVKNIEELKGQSKTEQLQEANIENEGKKYLENKAEEQKNVIKKLNNQPKIEQIQKTNIDNGEKSSNFWKWMLGTGAFIGAEELGRNFLFHGTGNNTGESTYAKKTLENNLNNDND